MYQMKSNRLIIIFLFLLTASCAYLGANDRRNAYLWMAHSYEYTGITKAIYASALDRVKEINASFSKSKTWGVIMDIDETILNNSDFQYKLIRNGASFTPELWDEWVRQESASAVPGSISFINKTKELGGLIILVSNRSTKHFEQTRRNLEKLGITYDGLYLQNEDADKTSRWIRAVSEKSFVPIMWVGDQLSDFPYFKDDGHEGEACPSYSGSLSYRENSSEINRILENQIDRCITILPNAAYGKWEK